MGPFAVRTGQKVYLNDTAFRLGPAKEVIENTERDLEITLRFYLHVEDGSSLMGVGIEALEQEVTAKAFPSLFGGDPTKPGGEHTNSTVIFGGPEPLPVRHVKVGNVFGCKDYDFTAKQGTILLVARGHCTFIQKLRKAKEAGAAGVIVASDDDQPINPTGDPNELETANDELSDVVLVVIPHTAAQSVDWLLNIADSAPGVQVMAVVDHHENRPNQSAPASAEKSRSSTRYLYVNGKPLINVELLV